MSRTEVIEVVNAMGREDRAFLSAYLKAKELSEDPDYAKKSSRTLASMRSGDRINSNAIREINDSLDKKGI